MRAGRQLSVAREMFAHGATDAEVSRALSIPRRTVNGWRRGDGQRRPRSAPSPGSWRPPDPGAYCYLLGVYLGDGHLTCTSPRSTTLRIVLDRSYPGIVQECTAAIEAVAPGACVRRYELAHEEATLLQACSVVWPAAFPQHGPGRKHDREILLEAWQEEVLDGHERQLLRGLIHSDGCRTINRFRTRLPSGRIAEYEYPRYFFTNRSDEIRGIFAEYCGRLGVHCTRSNAKSLSVARRDSVAILDSFIGPKR